LLTVDIQSKITKMITAVVVSGLLNLAMGGLLAYVGKQNYHGIAVPGAPSIILIIIGVIIIIMSVILLLAGLSGKDTKEGIQNNYNTSLDAVLSSYNALPNNVVSRLATDLKYQ